MKAELKVPLIGRNSKCQKSENSEVSKNMINAGHVQLIFRITNRKDTQNFLFPKLHELLKRQAPRVLPKAFAVIWSNSVYTSEFAQYFTNTIRDISSAGSTLTEGQSRILCKLHLGANRAKFIQGGSRGTRLLPFQQHNACRAGSQRRRSRLFCS